MPRIPRKPHLAGYTSDDYDARDDDDDYTDILDASGSSWDAEGEGEEGGGEFYYYCPSDAAAETSSTAPPPSSTAAASVAPVALETVDDEAEDYDALASLVPRLARAWGALRPLAPSLTEAQAVAALRDAGLDGLAALAAVERQYVEERRRRGDEGARVLTVHTRHLPGPAPGPARAAGAAARPQAAVPEGVEVPAERLLRRRWYVCGLPGAGSRTLLERVCGAAARRGAARAVWDVAAAGVRALRLDGWLDDTLPELLFMTPAEGVDACTAALRQCAMATVYERWESGLLLVVSAADGHLQDAIVSGALGRRLARLRLLCADRVVVAVTGMDAAGYSREIFREVAGNVRGTLEQCAPRGLAARPGTPGVAAGLTFCPVSGLRGANVDGPGEDEIPWYRGPSLMSLLFATPPPQELQRRAQEPMRCLLSNASYCSWGKVYVVQGMLPAREVLYSTYDYRRREAEEAYTPVYRHRGSRRPTTRPTYQGEFVYTYSRCLLLPVMDHDAVPPMCTRTIHATLALFDHPLPLHFQCYIMVRDTMEPATVEKILQVGDASGCLVPPEGAQRAGAPPHALARVVLNLPRALDDMHFRMGRFLDAEETCPRFAWVSVVADVEEEVERRAEGRGGKGKKAPQTRTPIRKRVLAAVGVVEMVRYIDPKASAPNDDDDTGA